MILFKTAKGDIVLWAVPEPALTLEAEIPVEAAILVAVFVEMLA
jgi:hypothetical protein